MKVFTGTFCPDTSGVISFSKKEVSPCQQAFATSVQTALLIGAVLKCKGLFFIFFLFEGFKNAASQCQVGVAEALQHLASGGATLAVFGIEYGKKKVEWSGTTS